MGLVICTIAAGAFEVALFHLVRHAFYKALLFIRVGALIHSSSGFQDLRNAWFSPQELPLVRRVIVVANNSLCALPFIRGWVSKDLCLRWAASSELRLGFFILLFMGAGRTALYTARSYWLLFQTCKLSTPLKLIYKVSLGIRSGILFLVLAALYVRACLLDSVVVLVQSLPIMREFVVFLRSIMLLMALGGCFL